MDLDLPTWQKGIWLVGYLLSAAISLAVLAADRILGRTP